MQNSCAVVRALKPLTILVADDHEIVRRGLCSVLEAQSTWKTVEASNGGDAVAKIRELRPDIVMLDIDMPEMNGWKRPDRSSTTFLICRCYCSAPIARKQ